jgi:flagellar protein FlaJ
MFGKKKRIIEVNGARVELEPKPTTLSGLFGKKKGAPKAAEPQLAPKVVLHMPRFGQGTGLKIQRVAGGAPYRPGPAAGPNPKKREAAGPAAQQPSAPAKQGAQQPGEYAAKPTIQPLKTRSRIYLYIERVEAKHKGLEAALREQGIRENVHDFIQRMLTAAIMIAVVLAVSVFFLLLNVGLPLINGIIFAIVIGISAYYIAFGEFLNYPSMRAKTASKNIERDILSAARDMIISLRSGMPLFNAIVAISTGYADASKEFAKVVERVQLGLPLEDAIDQTVSETKSASFKRMMLQASTSIKAGADVIDALESVISQLTEERVIESRRYGQKLNAIAMFYMLFGIILPSMGIAVLVILTTFIAIFTVTPTVLAFALVGIVFLQLVFMELIIGSRPTFTM